MGNLRRCIEAISGRARRAEQALEATFIQRVRLDFLLAPVLGTDSGAHCQNHPFSHQLGSRLGTGKQLGCDCTSPRLVLRLYALAPESAPLTTTGLKPSFSWALQSNALHAGIRDIAALQLACNGHWQSFSDFLVDVIRDSA